MGLGKVRRLRVARRHQSLALVLALSSLLGGCVSSEVAHDAGRLDTTEDVRTSDEGGTSTDAGGESANDQRAAVEVNEVAAEVPPGTDGNDTHDAAPDTAPTIDTHDAAPDTAPTIDTHDAAPDTAPAIDTHDAAPDNGPKADANDASNDVATSDDTNDGSLSEAGNIQDQGAGDPHPETAPATVLIATHTLGVDNKGTVFNVADDYFNDGFIPATPIANFGSHSQIVTVANEDGSLDVAWLDYANGKSAPWALPAPGPINLTHITADLSASTTTALGLSSYKLLGFTKDSSGNVYIGYNKDHPFKTTTAGDPNNINGNELHVAKLSGTTLVWDRLIFGDQDNNLEATLGDPGGAANGILGYDATNDRIVLYLGHSMMWFSATAPPTRHQAGFFRLLDPNSGSVIAPAGSDVVHFGAGWWYSHNFNQRLIVDGGNYYVLAHGDAFPRQLGFAKWSLTSYLTKNTTVFDQSYWTITGTVGDNKTDAQTGQFVKINDGRFLIVHTSSQGRSARDVRLVFSDGATGIAAEGTAVWLTNNQGTVQATMPKVEQLGDNVLVTYALWDSQGRHQLTWYAAVLDPSLNVVVAPQIMTNVEFVDSAPLFRFSAGPNVGAVGWVSGNSSHTLSVHVASLGH